MGTTTHFGFRYPEHGDPPAGFTQIQNLAEDVEAAMAIWSAKKAIVAPEQSTSSASYVLLGTPDRASGIVLPTNGLIVVAFTAQMKAVGGGASAGAAALFLGTDQVKVGGGAAGGAPAVQEAVAPDASGRYSLVHSAADGLRSSAPSSSEGDPVTTGQIVGEADDGSGGFVVLYAAAGTYDVSVRFKVALGPATVSVKNRKLWVASLAFA